MMKNENIKSKKVLHYVIPILILLIVIGSSYALWLLTREQEDPNVINVMDCLDISLNDVTSAINLTDAYAISNAEGMQTEPYTFSVTNNCNIRASISVALERLSASSLGADYTRVSLNDFGNTSDQSKILSAYDISTPATIVGATSYILKAEIYLEPQATKKFDLRIWIDNDTTWEQGSNKIFQGKIVISASPSPSQVCQTPIPSGSLAAKIISDNGGLGNIEEITDFNNNNDHGIFSANDDYCKSYYYRGNHDEVNNWVKFAGFYWRIIRIDGNGNIRMIYNGRVADGVPQEKGITTQLGTSAFNTNRNSNAYVGYMYGNPAGATYSLTHTKTFDSTIKIAIDDWYDNNINNQNPSVMSKIKDEAVYCGDREPSSAGVYDLIDMGTKPDNPGVGTENTLYRFYDKFIDESGISLKPSFSCENNFGGGVPLDNDQYHLPMGLITIDEFIYAGGSLLAGDVNNWLTTGELYWTMTPIYFALAPAGGGQPFVGIINSTGRMEGGSGINVSLVAGIRGVITLNSNVVYTSGNGTISNPYVVQ